jgi:Holliday junction resolvase RusA-like endonuclease
MGTEVRILIEGDPVAKGRPRFAMVNGKPITFTPSKTRNFEAVVSLIARQQAPETPLEGPLAVDIFFAFTVPKSRAKKKTQAQRYKDTKPDIDNLIKAVLDGLNTAGIWRDDAQIAILRAAKTWSESPRTVVTIRPVYEVTS